MSTTKTIKSNAGKTAVTVINDKKSSVFVFIACAMVIGISAVSLSKTFAPNGVPPPTAGDPNMQAIVASSTPLETVSGGDPIVQQAADTAQPGAVENVAGTNGNIKGTLTNIFYPRFPTGDMVLSFGFGPGSTQVHVQSKNFAKLPDMRKYLGRSLLVYGEINMGLHLPYVITSKPTDLKLIQ